MHQPKIDADSLPPARSRPAQTSPATSAPPRANRLAPTPPATPAAGSASGADKTRAAANGTRLSRRRACDRPRRSTTPSTTAEARSVRRPAPGSTAQTESATAPPPPEHPGSADSATARSVSARFSLTVRSPHYYYESVGATRAEEQRPRPADKPAELGVGRRQLGCVCCQPQNTLCSKNRAGARFSSIRPGSKTAAIHLNTSSSRLFRMTTRIAGAWCEPTIQKKKLS